MSRHASRRSLLLAGMLLAGIQAAGAANAQNTAAPANFSQRSFTNSIGMEFSEVPSGSFVMGRFAPGCPEPHGSRFAPRAPNFGEEATPAISPSAPQPGAVAPAAVPPDQGSAGAMRSSRPPSWTAEDDARCRDMAVAVFRPGFLVTVPNSYFLGRTEVTQAQFRAVMKRNPSYFDASRVENADRHPVEMVSWADAQAFVDRLNGIEGGHHYRLPSEAEWEWAARAGTEQVGEWTLLASRDTERYGVFRAFSEPGTPWTTAVVASKLPNAWGLYDMLGNVMEWTRDVYNGRFLPDAMPLAADVAANHVLKGKSFLTGSIFVSATDHAGGPSDGLDVGFRIVRDMEFDSGSDENDPARATPTQD